MVGCWPVNVIVNVCMITNALNAMLHCMCLYILPDTQQCAAIKIYIKIFFSVYMIVCHYKLSPGSWHSPTNTWSFTVILQSACLVLGVTGTHANTSPTWRYSIRFSSVQFNGTSTDAPRGQFCCYEGIANSTDQEQKTKEGAKNAAWFPMLIKGHSHTLSGTSLMPRGALLLNITKDSRTALTMNKRQTKEQRMQHDSRY